MHLLACGTDTSKEIDLILSEYSGSDKPGAVVMVIKQGKPIVRKAYGMAHLEQQAAMTVASNLRLASFTKQFTAMAIMLLAERGKLTYQARLTDIFPDFPAYGHQITIEQMLQHTSGLIAYEDLISDTATVQVTDSDVLAMMFEQDSTYFEPGLKYRYSNTGYAVLAMVVERLSGQSFAEFLRCEIFEPLDMSNTVAYQKGISTVPSRAYGYAATDTGFVYRDQSVTSAVLGDGGIYSSVDDLFKWDQALHKNALVSVGTFSRATSGGAVMDKPGLTYGFGWRMDEFLGQRRMHHTGSTSGFTTVIQRYPDSGFSIILLTNRNKPSVMGLANKIAGLYHN